jgi:hypothetical protein
MFVHKEQLEYALRPEDYSSPEVHRAEVDRCFLSAWHPVCLAGDLPRAGRCFSAARPTACGPTSTSAPTATAC